MNKILSQSWFLKHLLLFIILTGVYGCATSYDGKGKYHNVRGGETILSIARSYGVNAQETAELNNIDNTNDIEVGRKIYLPEKKKRQGYKKLPFGDYLSTDKDKKKKRSRFAAKEKEETQTGIKVDHGRFIWPVKGKLSSPFGFRNGRRHDGIDIAAKEGTPINAAGEGKVVFSGVMRGYGNLIIIRHKDDFFTVYAHNSKNIAKKGHSIKKAQLIGKVGRTGRSTGSHLHFEVRRGQTARNPLFFLPKNNGG